MPPTVQLGSSGSDVRDAQYLLARPHFLEAAQIDGSFGPVTQTAVEEFQGQEGLAADGVVGPATWAALFASFSLPPELAAGSTGALVGRLQSVLNNGRAQYAPGSADLVVDDDFGPLTRAMVVGFQTWGGVTADGVVGLQTWAVSLHAAGAELATAVGV
jgi:peptidoglycan hydrolase-like protein with peptidoglycan-binding domain